MKLTQAMQDFILHWGEMGTRWGVNRSVAQVHALLHLSPDPLPADTISELLGIARSNTSTALKELQGWGIVRIQRQLGDRRDHFVAEQDMIDLARKVAEGRRQREFVPTMEAVRASHDAALADPETPQAVKDRMAETLGLMEMADRWYADVMRLPRGAQMTMLRLGAGIARLLPKSDS